MLLPSLFTFFPPIFAHAIINLKRDYHENTKISHFSQLSTISMISMISIISRFSHPSQSFNMVQNSHPFHPFHPFHPSPPRPPRPPSNQRQCKRTGVSRLCVPPALREKLKRRLCNLLFLCLKNFCPSVKRESRSVASTSSFCPLGHS